MCLFPRLLKNRKYTVTKKNGGNVPKITDPRTAYVPIGCQKCIECRSQKARGWNIRLQEEIRHDKTAQFVTLTFSNEQLKNIIEGRDTKGKKITEALHVYEDTGEEKLTGYDLDNEVATIAVRRFLERWRKEHKTSVKHWLVTELGHNGTENIHLHGMIFTTNKKEIEKIWQYGWVYIGDYVNERTVNYTMKYVQKIDLKHREYMPKILTSAGIGGNYTRRLDAKNNKYKDNGRTRETYISRQGKEMNLPIYFRNKIYTDEQKEKLWIEKLDKQERWVMGVKVCTKHGLDQYYKVLETARFKNRLLGYGNDEKNWNRIHYENQLRQMKIEKRIANTIDI